MKKLTLLTFVALFALYFSGCTISGSSEDSYFGYDNNPEVERPQTSKKASSNTDVSSNQNTSNDFQNPLAQNNSTAPASSSMEERHYTSGDNYHYNSVHYVPVIVPWWSRYYGWGWSPYSSHNIYVYNGYTGYNWYSPYYSYNPYYGYDWYYHSSSRWYRQPVYAYHKKPVKPKTYRSFGSSRGTSEQTRTSSSRRYEYSRSGAQNSDASASEYKTIAPRTRTQSSSSSTAPARTGTSGRSGTYERTNTRSGSASGTSTAPARTGTSGRSGTYERTNTRSGSASGTSTAPARTGTSGRSGTYERTNTRSGRSSGSSGTYRRSSSGSKNSSGSKSYKRSRSGSSSSKSSRSRSGSKSRSSGSKSSGKKGRGR